MSADAYGGSEPRCPVCGEFMAGRAMPLSHSRAGSFGVRDTQYCCPSHGPRLPGAVFDSYLEKQLQDGTFREHYEEALRDV